MTDINRIQMKFGKVIVSIVTGAHAYCEPREDKGPYTSVEVGVWNHAPSEEMTQYSDDCMSTSDWECLHVYGYVPVEVLARFMMQLIQEQSN